MRPRLLILIACVLTAVALFLGGSALGWQLANRTISASTDAEARPHDEAAAVARLDAVIMPEVRGLSRADAEQVIADAGLSATVEFADAQSALPEGIVVTQEPLSGTTDPAKVVLGISVPAVMPDLVGADREEAIDALSDLAVAARIVFAYAPDADPGDIIATDPLPGQPLGMAATVTVAARGTALSLLDVGMSRDGCSTKRDIVVAGVDEDEGIVCDLARGTGSALWLLKGKADRLTATISLVDDSDPAGSAHVQVLADGASLLDERVGFGKTIAVDASVSGVLQLRVVVSNEGDGAVAVAVTDPVIVGADQAMAELTR